MSSDKWHDQANLLRVGNILPIRCFCLAPSPATPNVMGSVLAIW